MHNTYSWPLLVALISSPHKAIWFHAIFDQCWMIRVYVAIKDIMKQQIFISSAKNSFFHGAIQFNWCHWHSAAHRNISKKFVMLWAWKRSKTQIIWGTRKLIRHGIHGLPVSWQTQCHGALGRTARACKWGPYATTAGLPPTGGCCYSRRLMNETRIASTAAERRTGAADSCAGDRFTSRSYQSEGVKGPNPGKPGSHPLDTNPNTVPVTDANMGL